ncbi:glycosyltransferase family 2 protein [Aquimarina brevivitae]|uniref:Glycosyltransferase 2-like domain-containing protein n=1 Tax=Aquimarina brevivitae TaxID=323412 RepID=A0A4Q7PIA2_9FLAO|nr:glycosyltransferase family 2 protein [Aquimarina brevivitae]RZT00344.1 hypothetical protein EV197_1580 [Aquimarina brevivitae]
MNIDISVIILNYNSAEFTIDCIKSIQEKTSSDLNYELIVVDNASTIEDYQKLKSFIEKINSANIRLVRSKINTGFGTGNMHGVQYANGDYYAFVNNDTLLQNDCLQIGLNFLKENNTLICSPQQYDEEGNVKKSFDHFLTLKRELIGRKLLEKSNPKKYPKRKKVYDTPIAVQSVPGSFMIVEREAFDAAGGFDTNIFLYYEETDLCYRIAKQHKNRDICFLVPEARYTHFTGKSTKAGVAIAKELKISLFYVLKKNSGFIPYLILKWYLSFKYLLKAPFKAKNLALFKLIIKGAPLSESLKHQQVILNK